MNNNMEYRSLRQDEISRLKEQFCASDNWGNIKVHPDFNTDHIHRVNFYGNIELGFFEKDFMLPGGLNVHSGLQNVTLHNCKIGNDTYIGNISNYIANYNIGNNVLIRDIQVMYVEGISSFGNGVEVSVLNETGGREVMISDKLSAHLAYIMSCYRHRPVLINKLQSIITKYVKDCSSDKGTVGDNVRIMNSGTIKNVWIGSDAVIEGASFLDNGSINSNEFDPVHIGYNVMAQDFIISSGSKVEEGAMLTRCFVGQACHLGHTYSASDSLFFSNCQGENGEACAIFAGPYTVTHHKSTLLIAGMFSFMNAGSGSNQSNHMYKLGPIHQGIVERGGKTTSNSYVLWPAKIGAYSLIMGRHYQNSDTSDMPFSYLIESDDHSILVPGVNLRSVGTIRDAKKFPKRDKRKDPNRLDQINFNLLSPYTVQKMFRAIQKLKELKRVCGSTSEIYTYESCKIKNSTLERGIALYDMAINKFLGNSIISRLRDCSCENDEVIRRCLMPDTEIGLGEWIDLSGLLAPRSEIERLMDKIENGEVGTIDEINKFFESLHKDYYSLEWTWAWQKIQEYYDLSLEKIRATDIIDIIERWKEAVVMLDNMIYKDAQKEFSLSSQTGFGIDGGRDAQKTDFEQVRGVFEKNSFVEAVIDHIREKTQLGNSMISRLKK
jgi:carbonic anhydrase/acetyltransferase-like protein (isoleucine patch superfamily)